METTIKHVDKMLSPLVFISILSMLFGVGAAASQYKVGDDRGWTINTNYTEWANNHTFQEGDTIVFSYPRGLHNVLRVSARDYESCSVSNPIATDASGQTMFQLREGDYYFVCGFPMHCKLWQKVFFHVGPAGSPLKTPRVNGDFPINNSTDGAEAPGPDAFASLAAHSSPNPLILCLLSLLSFGWFLRVL